MEYFRFWPVCVALGWAFFHCAGRFSSYLLVPASARKTTIQAWKWKNVSVSFLHSLITGTGACVEFYFYPAMAADVIHSYSMSSHILVSFSIGYFIHDALDMALNNMKKSTYELLVHHVLVILCFGLAAVSGQYLGYALVALVIEVNSVFVHVRQMLIVQGMAKHAKPYRLNSLLNVATFLVFRITTMGWMTRWLVVNRDVVPLPAYTLGSVALATLMVMNIVLFFRILYADFRKAKRDGSGAATRPSASGGGPSDRIQSTIRRLVRGTEEEEVLSGKTD
ncbi:TLC domain-containing protein 2-like [Amphibalanus amphitrite]|uniref:TLC domain-containing protein 2-like n=1 Tax=Amphibalanus amphitrite TaxID=1232801 RepID=UPI001C91F559|nr:TLC domain-containing protein 2-like [Amphibalanus amphitrite]